jgi:hypothetical protein
MRHFRIAIRTKRPDGLPSTDEVFVRGEVDAAEVIASSIIRLRLVSVTVRPISERAYIGKTRPRD